MKYAKKILSLIAGTVIIFGCQDPDYPTPVMSSAIRSSNVVFINAAPDAPTPQPFLVNNAPATSVGFPRKFLSTRQSKLRAVQDRQCYLWRSWY